jgi:hypothetical protein
MQVGHGNAAPLRRIGAGDRVACYSPTTVFQGRDKLQAFTAIGIVRAGKPYQHDVGGGFRPFRRDVDWLAARDTPIQPLLDILEFTAGVRNWGYQLRFGLFPISDHDLQVIASAMEATLPLAAA